MAGLLDDYMQGGGLLGGLGQGGGISPMLLAAGAGLLGGQGWGGAIQGGLQAQQVQQQNALKNLMLRHSLSKDERDFGLRQAQFDWQRQNAGTTDDIKEFNFAKQQGFTGSLEDWMQRKRAGAGEYGLQPVYGVGPDGKPAIAQLGKSGTAALSRFPEGFVPSTGVEKIDLGTQWGVLDKRTGQIVGYLPKDIAGAAAQKAEGTALGGAKADLASIKSKMPGLESVVRQLDDLSNKATYTIAGQVIDTGMRQTGMEPREAAVARAQYTSMVDNQILPLLRDTFGAQFTQKEGQTLRETLGDPNKSPAEKQAILKSFIEQKRRDVEALELRTGAAPAAPAAPTNSAPDPLGIR